MEFYTAVAFLTAGKYSAYWPEHNLATATAAIIIVPNDDFERACATAVLNGFTVRYARVDEVPDTVRGQSVGCTYLHVTRD